MWECPGLEAPRMDEQEGGVDDEERGSGAAIALLVNSIANRGIQDSISCITCAPRRSLTIAIARPLSYVWLRHIRDQRDTQACSA